MVETTAGQCTSISCDEWGHCKGSGMIQDPFVYGIVTLIQFRLGYDV